MIVIKILLWLGAIVVAYLVLAFICGTIANAWEARKQKRCTHQFKKYLFEYAPGQFREKYECEKCGRIEFLSEENNEASGTS